MVIRQDEGLAGACALRRRCGPRRGVWLAPALALALAPRCTGTGTGSGSATPAKASSGRFPICIRSAN